MTVVPAYGRDYKSKKAVLADWEDKKDFLINDISCTHNGSYINIDDAAKGTSITFRYNKLRSVFIHQVK